VVKTFTNRFSSLLSSVYPMKNNNNVFDRDEDEILGSVAKISK
jgi:hypothetical protein